MGRFWTDYTWDVAAGLPVVTKMPQETRYIKTYVYGLDLISVYTDDLEHGATAQDYYFSDGLGSTVTLARDSTPTQSAAWTYDAFGEVRSTNSGTPSTSFLFTGDQFDAKARQSQGLYYLRARYYDPEGGRLLTKDPFPGIADQPQTLNAYAYALNSPALLADPTGLFGPCDILDRARDVGEPIADYVVDKVQDVGQYTVRRFVSPQTTFQDTVALGISLFSEGNRQAGPYGFSYYENCRGLCDLIADHVLDAPAFTPGYIGFAERRLGPAEVAHEAQHYLQSLVLGPGYLPLTFEEWVRSGFSCGWGGECLYKTSIIETDAVRAAKDKKQHFPFCPR